MTWIESQDCRLVNLDHIEMILIKGNRLLACAPTYCEDAMCDEYCLFMSEDLEVLHKIMKGIKEGLMKGCEFINFVKE